MAELRLSTHPWWGQGVKRVAFLLNMNTITVRRAFTEGRFGTTFVANALRVSNRPFDELFFVADTRGGLDVPLTEPETPYVDPDVPMEPYPYDFQEAIGKGLPDRELDTPDGSARVRAVVFTEPLGPKDAEVRVLALQDDGDWQVFPNTVKSERAMLTVEGRFGLTAAEVARCRTLNDDIARSLRERREDEPHSNE